MKADGRENFNFSIRPHPISEFMIVIFDFWPSIFDRPLLTARFALKNWPGDLIYETLHNDFPANIFICIILFLILCIDTVSTIFNSIFTRLIKTYLRIRYQFLSLIINKQAKNFRIFKIPKPAHKIPAGEKMHNDLWNEDQRSLYFESIRSVN